MSAALAMLLGLAGGLGAGAALAAAPPSWSTPVVSLLEPVGTLFINAIRMTVVPLIVSKLIVSVASLSDEGAARRVGASALLIFVPTVALATVLAMLTVAPVMRRVPIDPAAAETLRRDAGAAREQIASAAETLPGIRDWVVGLVPTNAVAAAAEGAMLPLIVFSLAFGFALARVPAGPRASALQLFTAIAEAMQTLVRWILIAAPIGVFALALPLAARLGLAAAGALVYYVAAVAVACAAFAVLVLYPAAVLLGRVPLGRFAAAAAPAQAIAFSSRSSLASLPAMIESARTRLGIADEVASMFLPLAAAMFRAGSAIASTVAVLFLARLYGVPLDASAMFTTVAVVTLTSLGLPGIPSGALLVILPVLAAAGIPAEGVGILLAVDVLPDMIRTATNITADMAAVTIVPAPGARS